MSQLALGYTLTHEALDALRPLAAARNYDAFWRTLADTATDVSPAYGYSGYVLVVLFEFLREAGVAIPVNTSHLGALAMIEAQIDLLLCAAPDDLTATHAALANLQPTIDELQNYFADFTGDHWDEAGVAMQAALHFLQRGLEQAQAHNQWLLVFVS